MIFIKMILPDGSKVGFIRFFNFGEESRNYGLYYKYKLTEMTEKELTFD